jgi:hypothetical protein
LNSLSVPVARDGTALLADRVKAAGLEVQRLWREATEGYQYFADRPGSI